MFDNNSHKYIFNNLILKEIFEINKQTCGISL